MRARTRTEKEVMALSEKLRQKPTEAQKRWMLSHSKAEDAGRYHRRKADVMHFIVITVCHGWQVLRHFYCYAYYRRKALVETQYYVVMEEWLKDGRYVFLCRDRFCLGGLADAWCLDRPMEVRRGELGGCFTCDPREMGYCDTLFVRVQDKYKYLPSDKEVGEHICKMYRAVNANPYNETLLKQNKELFDWSFRNNFLYDTEKTNAIKIAQRYHYKVNDLWCDMVEALAYLGKDLHNPALVCPKNGMEAHDKWTAAAGRKRLKMQEKMAKLARIRDERIELRRLELQAQWAEQREKEAKAAIPYYKKARGRFFGLCIAENEVEIKVLQSVQEFMEEGKEMEHCVFSNAYYDVKKKPYCLILSAKVNGARCETIEVNLKDYSIVQCRGKRNMNTPYHDTILKLMSENMNEVKRLNTTRAV